MAERGRQASSGSKTQPSLQLAPLDEASMTAVARQLAQALQPPLSIFFEGDLGAGKTTFIRALIHGLGYQGTVKSPSYGLLEPYELDTLTVVHLDLYRIADPEELEYLALGDLLGPATVLLVEWPGQGGTMLPRADVLLEITPTANGDERSLTFHPQTNSGINLCLTLESLL